jgi:hypothetical protein
MILALVAAVQFLGFSPAGKTASYIERGVNESSGKGYVKLHTVDVVKGTETVTAFSSEEELEAREMRISNLWVVPRKVAHDEHGGLSDPTGAPIGTLELTARKAGKNSCDEPFEPLALGLVMRFRDDDKPVTVGTEKAPPKSRPCAQGCAIDQVYAHATSVAVVVKCTTPGFEGKGEAFSVFAKVLPHGLGKDLPPQ